MLAHSVSLDKRIGKTLVAGPAGMNTTFWKGHDRGPDLLSPKWVATQILNEHKGYFHYKCIRILRSPPRVKVVEETR